MLVQHVAVMVHNPGNAAGASPIANSCWWLMEGIRTSAKKGDRITECGSSIESNGLLLNFPARFF